MIASTEFAWGDRYLTGHAGIDSAHQEFVALVNALLAADDSAVEPALNAFARHAVAHFGAEERLMERYAFPARVCHGEEHGKVLASVHEVQARVAAGDVQAGRDLAQALVEWFPGHTDYLDSAIAVWVVRKVHHGAPVVLRRAMQSR